MIDPQLKTQYKRQSNLDFINLRNNNNNDYEDCSPCSSCHRNSDGGAKTNFRSSEIRPTDPFFLKSVYFLSHMVYLILDSIVVSIPACHAGDRGSIPRRGVYF